MWNSIKSYLILLKLTRIIWGSFLTFLGILFVMKIIFPLIGQVTFSKTGFQVSSYYSLIVITLVCLFPYLIGILYAKVIRRERGYQSPDHTASIANNNFLLLRMLFAVFICFVFVLLTSILLKPVPTEGWLRNLFATCLISIQAPFVCMMICTLIKKKVNQFFIFVFCSIFLITILFGLLVHHPWNYFVFFSPLYWVAWAWVISSPLESLLYGTISLIITSVALIIFLRSLLRSNSF
jgi:hypothetical protein